MPDSDVILLVEDDPDDVFLMKRALKSAGILATLHIAEHGQAALDYLAGAGPYADRTGYPFPSLVFLDLKLPYKSGFEVLTWFREQPSFELAAVVVLTSSGLERDMQQAYKLGARSYLVKTSHARDVARTHPLAGFIPRENIDRAAIAIAPPCATAMVAAVRSARRRSSRFHEPVSQEHVMS